MKTIQTGTPLAKGPQRPQRVEPTALTFSRPLRTEVVGILNLTPDSFSDGGRYPTWEFALERAEEMQADGADWIDVGGVSTKPGAPVVSLEEERARVMPVLQRLCRRIRIPVSLDTSRYEIAREGLDLGVRMINDVRALRGRGGSRIARLVAQTGVRVVLMHMQGEPRTMQQAPRYTDVVGEISAFFAERVRVVRSEGVRDEAIILDPGIGFGKTREHNLEILRRMDEFSRLGFDLMVGPSRKSLIGDVLGVPVSERLNGTEALVALSIRSGVRYVRVHDTREMVEVARMTDAVLRPA